MISAPHAPLPRRAPALVLLLACLSLFPILGRAQADNPYGDCCVSNVTMSGVGFALFAWLLGNGWAA